MRKDRKQNNKNCLRINTSFKSAPCSKHFLSNSLAIKIKITQFNPSVGKFSANLWHKKKETWLCGSQTVGRLVTAAEPGRSKTWFPLCHKEPKKTVLMNDEGWWMMSTATPHPNEIYWCCQGDLQRGSVTCLHCLLPLQRLQSSALRSQRAWRWRPGPKWGQTFAVICNPFQIGAKLG